MVLGLSSHLSIISTCVVEFCIRNQVALYSVVHSRLIGSILTSRMGKKVDPSLHSYSSTPTQEWRKRVGISLFLLKNEGKRSTV